MKYFFLFMLNNLDYVNIRFWRGESMDDPSVLLLGESDKRRHIKITQDTVINKKAIADFIKQAIALNKKLGNTIR